MTARERPDVALVGLGLDSEHALELITEIVREAACPVIALLSAEDPAYVHEAAKRGVFAYIVDSHARGAAERDRYHATPLRRVPQPAGRVRPPSQTQRAKGILMERHAIDADRALADWLGHVLTGCA